MGLDVRLSDDVQAKLVARVEEGRIVGVVRRSNGVEAEPLHGDDVGPEVVGTHAPAGHGVEVVAIDAPDEDRPTIDQQLHTPDHDAPEPHPKLHALRDRPVRCHQRDLEPAERGDLR